MSKPRLIMTVFLAACLFGSPVLWTQDEEVVQAKAYLSRNKLHAGETFKLAVQLKINGGWHINANPVNDEFLLPTLLSIEENNKARVVRISYPKPQLGKFEYAEAELQIYAGEAFLGALMKAEDNLALGTFMITGLIDYQACNDRFCLPPKEIRLEIPVEVVSISVPTEDIAQEIFSKIEFPTEIK